MWITNGETRRTGVRITDGTYSEHYGTTHLVESHRVSHLDGGMCRPRVDGGGGDVGAGWKAGRRSDVVIVRRASTAETVWRATTPYHRWRLFATFATVDPTTYYYVCFIGTCARGISVCGAARARRITTATGRVPGCCGLRGRPFFLRQSNGSTPRLKRIRRLFAVDSRTSTTSDT